MIDKLNKITEKFVADVMKAIESLTLDELAGMMVARASGGAAKPKRKYTRHVGKKLGRPKGSKNKPKAVAKAKPKAEPKPVPEKKVSAATAKARKVQGQYLGHMRHLKKGNKYRIRAMNLAKKSGVAAAVKYLLEKQKKGLI